MSVGKRSSARATLYQAALQKVEGGDAVRLMEAFHSGPRAIRDGQDGCLFADALERVEGAHVVSLMRAYDRGALGVKDVKAPQQSRLHGL